MCVCVYGGDALWCDTLLLVVVGGGGWGLEPGLWAVDKGECQAMWIKDVGL